MRRAAAVTVLGVSLIVSGASAAGPRDVSDATVLAVQAWVTFVESHTPGRRDAPLLAVAAWSFDARRTLNDGMGLFVGALRGHRAVASSEAQRRIVEIGRTVRQRPGQDVFLKRAAVLHSDVAIYCDRFPPPAAGPPEGSPRGAPVSPLLSNHKLILDKDGEILGETVANWNWPFARSLLDLLASGPDDPFVGTWYHATAVFMFGRSLHGEATPHLERAAAALPDDPRILFDRGCFSEMFGLPRSQVLLSDMDIATLRARRMSQPPPKSTVSAASQLGIPPEDVANDDAERLFRRALRADPWLVEARVRLARLLDLRKRHEEAASELAQALEGPQGGIVSFYAHLFAGRAAQALGRMDEAAGHYRRAGALFPGAQSALLAQSQLSLLTSDVPSALGAIQRLDKSSTASDPWWSYHLGPGRDADAILADMWAKVPKF